MCGYVYLAHYCYPQSQCRDLPAPLRHWKRDESIGSSATSSFLCRSRPLKFPIEEFSSRSCLIVLGIIDLYDLTPSLKSDHSVNWT